MYPVYDFGGDGPLLHLAVANGFPPQTYKPFVEPLTAKYRVVCLLPRALWPDESPPEKMRDWGDTLARDLIAGIRHHDLRKLVAVGHSFGGIATMLAAIEAPERFRAVILLDPTILPPYILLPMRVMRWFGRWSGGGLDRRAERRREYFASTDEAYAYFKTKRLFADWPDQTVRLYAESCAPASGGGVTLAWPREWEAYYFRTVYAKTWSKLPDLRGRMPLLTVRGGESDTLLPESVARMQRVLPEMAYTEITGHGHLFPQSAPEKTYQAVVDWLEGVL